MERVLANLAGAPPRRAQLHGRDHLVVPVTLIVPGVLNGSHGPLFYPPDEIARYPSAWDHMPIVLQHPIDLAGEHLSARTSDVLNRQAVGIVLGSRVDGGKLKADGWFDIARTRAVNSGLLSKLESGQEVEVSTGLFTDNEAVADGAAYNGQPYQFIARNYRPDHLAVLLGQVGACSIADGCGLNVNAGLRSIADRVRRVEEREERRKKRLAQRRKRDFFASDVGAAAAPQSVAPGLIGDAAATNATKTEDDEDHPAAHYAYVPDPEKPSTWKLRIDDAQHVGGAIAAIGKGFRGQKVDIPASDLPAVKKRIKAAWKKFHPDAADKDMPKVLLNFRGVDMDKTQIVDFLVSNACCWNEADREYLSGLDDSRLVEMKATAENDLRKHTDQAAVVNAATASFTADDGREFVFNAEAKTWAVKDAKPLTAEEWLGKAPAEVQAAVRNAMALETKERERLVAALVATAQKADQERVQNRLKDKSLEELRDLAALVPAKQMPSYLGAAVPAGGPAEDDTFDILPVPVTNWAEKVG